nr:uncharacterized protein LOC123773096 [Procambarus clarkii]
MTSLGINSFMAPLVNTITTRAPMLNTITTRAPMVSNTTTRAPVVSNTTTRAPMVSNTTTRAPSSIFNDPRYVIAAEVATGILLTSFVLIVSDTIGRRRRDTNDLNDGDIGFLRQALYKVVTNLDDSGCAALALCHATSLPPEARTTDHNTVIAALRYLVKLLVL